MLDHRRQVARRAQYTRQLDALRWAAIARLVSQC